MNSLFKLREITQDDEKILYAWANEGEARRQAICQRPVTKCEHKAWFYKHVRSANTIIWVFEENRIPVGQIRWERRGNIANLSYTIDQNCRRKGLGTIMLSLGIDLVKQRWPDVELIAEAKECNMASIKALKKNQFREIYSKNDGLCRLIYDASV